MVLLREDPRVQAAYAAWQERADVDERAGAATNPSLFVAGLRVDVSELAVLVRRLGLAYPRLPKALLLEFCRTAAGVRIDETLPNDLVDLPWDLPNRKPKQGEIHQEDLERNVMWWDRKVVKGEKWKSIERDYLAAKRSAGLSVEHGRANVKNGVKRVTQLLGCIHQVGVGRAKDLPVI